MSAAPSPRAERWNFALVDVACEAWRSHSSVLTRGDELESVESRFFNPPPKCSVRKRRIRDWGPTEICPWPIDLPIRCDVDISASRIRIDEATRRDPRPQLRKARIVRHDTLDLPDKRQGTRVIILFDQSLNLRNRFVCSPPGIHGAIHAPYRSESNQRNQDCGWNSDSRLPECVPDARGAPATHNWSGHIIPAAGQRRMDVRCGGVSCRSVLVQRSIDDRFELRRDVRTYRSQAGRRLVENRVHHRKLMLAGERQPACEHLVQHNTERPNVGHRVRRRTGELLWSHVGDCPQRRPGARDSCLAEVNQFRDAEIDDFGEPVLGEHQVRRLDVAVDNPRGMRLGEPLSHLHGYVKRLMDGQRTSLDALLQRLAVIKGHHDEHLAV